MVRVHESGARHHDPVAVRVRIVGEGQVEPVTQVHQPRHRERRGRVHPDPPVPVQGHEPELRVHPVVGHRQVEAVALTDRAPVRDGRAAQRVHAQPQPRRGDRRHVHHVAEVRDVGTHEVIGGGMKARPLERDARHTGEAVGTRRLEDPVRLVLDPAGDVGVRGAAVGRVVLEAPVLGRVVRRRHDDAVGEPVRPASVGHEDRVRDRGRGRVPVRGIDPGIHAVRDEHLERRAPRGLRQRVRVPADEQRPRVAQRSPVAADRLGRGQDVGLVEGGLERRSAVAGRPERDPLGGFRWVRAELVVRPQERRHVHQVGREGGLAGSLVLGHQGLTASGGSGGDHDTRRA